jgi:hypothetical protein
MDKTVDELIRQQYLVPRRSVAKLRQLSKLQKVSATEIVRRAIDAYDPLSEDRTVQEAAALELLAEVHGELRKAIRRIDSDTAALRLRQRALDDGSLREQARRDTDSWLRRNPQAVPGLSELFGGALPELEPPGGARPASARTSAGRTSAARPGGARSAAVPSGTARASGAGTRLRALRR